ncbi:UDP-glucuronosyltransferase 2A3-like isoform X2 [Amphiura filiformis]|uniref:UDP-glucuronosyltransferase 2A3-like isoform X2 n=1 Tax=Amphiura filiformis TaxID=82378 RepID=UPI003B226310
MPAIPPSGGIRMYCNPVNPAYSPELFTGYLHQMTFTQRLKNTIYSIFQRQLSKITYRYLDELKQKYNINPEISTFETLSQAEIWFIYGNFVLDFPRPYQPNVISVGGITANPARPLAKDLEDFMQSSGNNGIIVFSMGSYVTAMDTHMVDVFADAFAKLPQNVISKSAGQPPTTLPANVKMLEWLPQNDILGHPKTRLLICQCGINSVFEAIYHGIPVICIPVQSDQWDNAKRLEVKGVGLQLDLRSLTSDVLIQAVETVLRNDSYQSKMSRLSNIFHDEHLPAPQRTVYWMEKVVRHGGVSHLRTSAFDLNVIQYSLIDVYSFLGIVMLVSVVTFIYLWILLCRFASRCCYTKRERQKTE